MVFDNFEELKQYVEKAQKVAIRNIAEEEKKELQREVKKQVYDAHTPTWSNIGWEDGKGWNGRTGATYKNIEYQLNGNLIILRLKNDKSWHSVYNQGVKAYAFATLEAGTTWNRGGTNIEETVINSLNIKIPQIYKETMNSLGVPVI